MNGNAIRIWIFFALVVQYMRKVQSVGYKEKFEMFPSIQYEHRFNARDIPITKELQNQQTLPSNGGPAAGSQNSVSIKAPSNLNVNCSSDVVDPNDQTSADSKVVANGSKGSGGMSELQRLVQNIYVAQAQVQLEAKEIQSAQALAVEAQKELDKAASHVRVITAALQTAQQEVATAAMRAQTAQLQLAAHDQLLFAARQKVDALSSQMVGLQAKEGIVTPKVVVDIENLLKKLREPLTDDLKPTGVPSILGDKNGEKSVSSREARRQLNENHGRILKPSFNFRTERKQPEDRYLGHDIPESDNKELDMDKYNYY